MNKKKSTKHSRARLANHGMNYYKQKGGVKKARKAKKTKSEDLPRQVVIAAKRLSRWKQIKAGKRSDMTHYGDDTSF